MVNDDDQLLATNETSVLAANDLLRSAPVLFNLVECWRWKISNDGTCSHLRIRRRSRPTFTLVDKTMRSLNSSKLDSTGCVTPEFCVVDARHCRSCDYIFAAPFGKHISVVRNLIFGVASPSSSPGSPGVRLSCADLVAVDWSSSLSSSPSSNNLRVSNIEVIDDFSEYFEKSLRKDSELRKGIPDLNLNKDLGEWVDLNEEELSHDASESDQVTTLVSSSAGPSLPSALPLSEEFTVDEMKNKKKSSIPATTVEETRSPESEESIVPQASILKSALKRGSKKFHKKKHRVQFDESLNKFFEADYVILVRDEEYDDDYGRCECGNQFCYEGCYYEDENEEDYETTLTTVDSPRYDLATSFDTPIDFVDPLTLSPPDGYKDGCYSQPTFRVQSAVASMDNEETNVRGNPKDDQEKLQNENMVLDVATVYSKKSKIQENLLENCSDYGSKKDTQMQGYPFYVNNINPSSQPEVFNETNGQSRYIVETITMTTVMEHCIVHESSNDQMKVTEILPDKYNNSGILKGGKLWRNRESNIINNTKQNLSNKISTSTIKMDTNDQKRGVKFRSGEFSEEDNCCDGNKSQNMGAFTLTFKLGNRVVPCNSLKPNSAVRQLFPDPRFVNPPASVSEMDCNENLGKCEGKYLITEESLRAFNEVNRRSVFAKFKGKERYPYKNTTFTIQSDDEDIPQSNLLKKTIEHNTLRRSLIRYPKVSKRGKKKCEVSLEERIKQLCIDDEIVNQNKDDQYERVQLQCKEDQNNKEISAYKKFSELFRRVETLPAIDQHYPYYETVGQSGQSDLAIQAKLMAKKPTSNEAGNQFLLSLTPLTACVSDQSSSDSNYSNRDCLNKLKLPGNRYSIVSNTSSGTDYSLGDIDDALCKPHEGQTPQPDVVANTPNINSGTNDELAMFVQQDASRIERIKKRYNTTSSNTNDDDEHDDYGFSRRPSVRSIKSHFDSTTKILQQIQAQLQPPLLTCSTKTGLSMTWPYYGTEIAMNTKNSGTISPYNTTLPVVTEKNTAAKYAAKVAWENSALAPHVLPHPLKVDTGSSNVQMLHLTPTDSLSEVTMPFKYDGAQFPLANNIFQMKLSPVSTTASQVRFQDSQLAAHPIPMGTTSVIRMGHGQQQTFRVPCPVSGPVQVHLLATHHYENPPIRSSQPLHFPSQIVVAKGTQTSSISTTSFYQLQTQSDQPPLTKANTFTTTTEQAKLIQVNYASAHPPPTLSTINASPTRVQPQTHLMEHGTPEGAVSSSFALTQDCIRPMASSLLDSATNQQQNKPASTMMYGMKV